MSRGDGALFSVDFTSDGNVVIKEEKTKGKNTRATYVTALMLAWKRLSQFKSQAYRQKDANEQYFSLLEKYKTSLLNLESAFAGNCIELTFKTDLVGELKLVFDDCLLKKIASCSAAAANTDMFTFGLMVAVTTSTKEVLNCGATFFRDHVQLSGETDTDKIWFSESLPLTMLDKKQYYK